MEWMPSQINLFCAFIAMDKQGRNNSLCGEDKLKKKNKKIQESCPCFHLSENWISLPSGEISGVLIVFGI